MTRPEDKVFAILAEAADLGRPAPSNVALAGRIGASSSATPARMIMLLERRGLITVERFSAGRVVTIAATGRATAYVGSRTPHGRAGRGGAARKAIAAEPVGAVDRAEPGDAAPPSARVHRDPCFRCGTRGDAGCAHQPVPDQPGEATMSKTISMPTDPTVLAAVEKYARDNDLPLGRAAAAIIADWIAKPAQRPDAAVAVTSDLSQVDTDDLPEELIGRIKGGADADELAAALARADAAEKRLAAIRAVTLGEIEDAQG